MANSSGFQWADYAAVGIYLAALVAVGAYFGRREQDTERFFLGGRRIPWWAAGISIFSTELSAITFMAIPAKSYAGDWVFFTGNMTIPLLAPLVVFVYLPHLRRAKLTSAYEYLERRFNLTARLLGAAAFIAFQLGRMGIVLFLPALALSTVTGTDIYACILVMGTVATVYTAAGGIEAVIWTDVLQAVVLVGGALLSVIWMVAGVDGGLGGIIDLAASAGKFRAVNLSWSALETSVWVMIVGSALTKLVNYTSDQTVVQRYLSVPTDRQAAGAVWTSTLMAIPSSFLFFFVGTALWAFYRQHPALLSGSTRMDDIFPYFIVQQLPAGVGGLVIAGLLAAAMSSMDSSINSMSTVIVTDFYRRFRPAAGQRRMLVLARMLTVILGAAGTASALYMAHLKGTSMFDHYLAVVGLFGGALAGMFAAGVFFPWISGTGVVAGFAAGAAAIYAVKTAGAVHFLLFAPVGIITCVGVGLLVSLFQQRSR